MLQSSETTGIVFNFHRRNLNAGITSKVLNGNVSANK